MRVPFLRSSPAARSTSKTAKRRIFLAGLLDGIDTAAGSLASANFLPTPTVWGFSRPVAQRISPWHPHVASDGSRTSGALAPTLSRRRPYNAPVSAASPPPDRPSPKHPSKLHIHKLEAGGISIIGALILLLTLTRFWHHIAWGAR